MTQDVDTAVEVTLYCTYNILEDIVAGCTMKSVDVITHYTQCPACHAAYQTVHREVELYGPTLLQRNYLFPIGNASNEIALMKLIDDHVRSFAGHAPFVFFEKVK